jgi:hypothetical protein
MACFRRKPRLHRMHLLLIFVPLFVLGSICCKRPTSPQGYDGSWWMITPLDQRLGFIDGFVDCYTYGCREESKLCAARNELETAVSSYYATHHADESMLVGEVLIRVAKSEGASSVEGRDSSEMDQNTGADGLLWLKYSPKKRLGFVEGCLNALMPQTSRSVFFPKNPGYYSDAVTRFYTAYSTNQSQTDTREDPLTVPISKVLWGLRNQRR